MWLTENADRLAEFRRGSPDVLAQIYRVYGPRLVGWLKSGIVVCGHGTPLSFHRWLAEDDRHDLVQETFMRAFSSEARERYDGMRPFWAYLCAIAQNLVLDRGRSLQRETSYLERTGHHATDCDEQSRSESPEAYAIRQQLSRTFHVFIRGLGGTDRALFEMRFKLGASRQRVAASTGYSIKQIRCREKRLLGRLERYLSSASGG